MILWNDSEFASCKEIINNTFGAVGMEPSQVDNGLLQNEMYTETTPAGTTRMPHIPVLFAVIPAQHGYPDRHAKFTAAANYVHDKLSASNIGSGKSWAFMAVAIGPGANTRVLPECMAVAGFNSAAGLAQTTVTGMTDDQAQIRGTAWSLKSTN